MRIRSPGTLDSPAATPRPRTTSWSLFPPKTDEVQFDEKWAFVGKKQKNCAPEDDRRGDCWDHVALDPETRLVVGVVVGKRTTEATRALIRDFRRRTGSRVMRLMTSDEYPVYADVIREAYGTRVTPPRTGRRGRPRAPYTVVGSEVTYATVHKERENNRVVRVSTRVVFGTADAVAKALASSRVSRSVNTCFVERHNGMDRLILGLHGMMNEAELHVLKQRMYQGKLNKARRGELFAAAPIGYIRSADRAWAIDPDEEVQAVVRLIFDQFDREATMHGLLRYLVHHKIRIPVRPVGGPNKGQLEWRRPNRATLQNLLRHPSYAGAYRYGHRPIDPRKKRPGRPNTGKLVRRPEECLVLLRDRLPAYITWERFEANQARLTANRNLPGTPGASRNGPAVLAGLVRCGRCDRRMVVRYAGPSNRPSYACTRGSADYAEPLCQALSNGAALDALVAEQLLAAVAPAALEASLAAVAGVERQREELERQWRLRRERAAIEAGRAERQYHACEPENRLVARTLERRWEEALKHRQQLDDEYERWRRSAPAELSDSALSSIRALAADLPAVWSAATTAPADRQRIARLLLERVVVTVDKASARVDVVLHWVGGAVRSHTITRPVTRYSQQSEHPRLVTRLRELCDGRLGSAAIAGRLNAEGFRPPKRTDRFTAEMVRRLSAHLGLARRQRHGSATGLGADEYRPMQLARRLGVSRDAIRGWVRRGWVTTRRDADGHHVIWADADELRRLGQLPGLRPNWANKERLAALRRPKPRPA